MKLNLLKTKTLITILLLLLSLNISAANIMLDELPDETMDSVDIRALVLQQIEKARLSAIEKEEENEKEIAEINNKEEEEEMITVAGSDYFDPTIIAGSVLFLFSLAGGLFYLLKKNKQSKTQSNERKEFKENIKKIRNEKRIDLGNNQLQSVRTGLLNDVGSISGGAAVINFEARRRSIAKGELYLAAKIKSFELSKIDNYR